MVTRVSHTKRSSDCAQSDDRLVRETRVTVILIFYLCTICIINNIYIYIYYAVNKKGVSCKKQGVSWTKIAFRTFQMFLILLSFITLGSESQILCSSNVKATLRCLLFWRGSMHRSQNLEIFRKNFSRLSSAFILKYYPIFHRRKIS